MLNPFSEYLDAVVKIVEEIRHTQMKEIKKAAQLCANCIVKTGLVHLFGSGHSRVSVEEMFPRYGSFVGFHPIVELSLTYHTQIVGNNGQRQARFLEDIEGLGSKILENFVFQEPDVMLIFSNSGLHNVGIDVALGAKQRNMPVIAVVSVEQCKALPSKHSTGKKLIDIANIVLDTCCPPGDAMVKMEGIEYLIGPGSTIASAVVANVLKCEIAAEMARLGHSPIVFVNPYFGEEVSETSIAKCYDEYRKRVVRVYGGGPINS